MRGNRRIRLRTAVQNSGASAAQQSFGQPNGISDQRSDFVYALSRTGVKQQGAVCEDDMVVPRYTDAERRQCLQHYSKKNAGMK